MMKILKLSSILILLATNIAFAQEKNEVKKTDEIKIKVSSQCNTCKKIIEKALYFEKGVKSSDLDVKNKIVTVLYNPSKTTPDKIRNAISKAGYDADDVKADENAYQKLPKCCQLGGH